MATVIGAVIVFGIVGVVCVKLIRDKLHHKGGCSCGGDCSGCTGGCHSCK